MSRRSVFPGGLLFVLAAMFAVGITVAYIFLNAQRHAARDTGTAVIRVAFDVPAFSLAERSGQTVTREDLLGSVWIVNAVFTRCPGPCARMTQEMARLQTQLEDSGVRFLSVTVDPDYDTPVVLAEYAKLYGADPDRWWFLTGEMGPVREFLIKGLRMAVVDVPEDDVAQSDHGPIVHSTRFVLLDHRASIRGYFEGLDEHSRAELVEAARALAAGL